MQALRVVSLDCMYRLLGNEVGAASQADRHVGQGMEWRGGLRRCSNRQFSVGLSVMADGWIVINGYLVQYLQTRGFYQNPNTVGTQQAAVEFNMKTVLMKHEDGESSDDRAGFLAVIAAVQRSSILW